MLIFLLKYLVFPINSCIFVLDKNIRTMINFSKFNSLYSVAMYMNSANVLIFPLEEFFWQPFLSKDLKTLWYLFIFAL